MQQMDRIEDGMCDVSFLTIEEVAKLLRVSKATAYRMREDGELPAIRVRGQYRVPQSWLTDMVATAPDRATA
jgi:excisionase family DNA binding protein